MYKRQLYPTALPLTHRRRAYRRLSENRDELDYASIITTEVHDWGEGKGILHGHVHACVGRDDIYFCFSEFCQHYLAQTDGGSLEWSAL